MWFTKEDKELKQLKKESQAITDAIEKRKLRAKLQYDISRYKVLSGIEHVEYQDERIHGNTITLPAKKKQTLINTRFPCYTLNGKYPFHEQEHWEQIRYEDDNPFFRFSNDMNWLMGWSPQSLGLGGQFPREMMPGSLASIRQMTGLDLLRFQSKIMYETIAPYSGVVNHLINYTCGDKGAKIYASSKEDPEAAKEISEYLENWMIQIDFLNKLRGSCQQLLVQGEFLLRRWNDGRITLTDPSWLRGPNNEQGQNPWSLGILSPNWPYEIDTVGAYHLWYPSNEHEDVSPKSLFHGKLDSSTGPSAKRSVPLNYRIRLFLPILESLLTAMGGGEEKRQKIAGVVTYDAARPDDLPRKGFDSPFAGSLMDILEDQEGPLNAIYNETAGFYNISKGQHYDAPPSSSQGESGCTVYDKIATVAANACGVASWMFGADFKEASYATSLTASEPTVMTAKNIQRILSEGWEKAARAEVEFNFNIENTDLQIHVELPDCEVRDKNEMYDRLSKQMADRLKAPQSVCAEMGDDFEEQQELIKIAKETGWQTAEEKAQDDAKINLISEKTNKDNK